MTPKQVLDKWAGPAKYWETRRLAKHMTAWEACGLQLWIALNQALAESEKHRARLAEASMLLDSAGRRDGWKEDVERFLTPKDNERTEGQAASPEG